MYIVAFFDFSKAFDKVNFCELFKKLIDRKIPFIILRLLLFIYRKQKCCVKWNNHKSQYFNIKNGVRQGAVVSPSLYCIYLDTLLKIFKNSHFGCHIGNIFMGAFGYADDIILLAPTRHALQLISVKILQTLMICFSALILFPEKVKPSVSTLQQN